MYSRTNKGKFYACSICKHKFISKRGMGECPECVHELNMAYAKEHPLEERKKWLD